MTCGEIENAFKECKNEKDVLKLCLVYFVEAVLGAKSNVVVNLDYLHLVEDMDRLNNFVVLTEVERNQVYWTWTDDDYVLMLDNFTLTSHENDIYETTTFKKLEELTKLVEYLRMEVKTKPVEEEEEVVHENEDVEDDGEKDGDKEDDVEEKEEQAEGEDENEEKQEMKEKGGTQGIMREEIMKVVGEEALKYRTAKEDVNGSYTDDEVVIFTLEGEHLGTKIRITLLKAIDKKCLLDDVEHFYHFKMVKENDKDLVAPLDIRTDGDTDFWRQLLELQGGLSANLFLLRKHQHKLHIVRPVLITSTNDYFLRFRNVHLNSIQSALFIEQLP
ncbi:unnamed protein product [Malus baccata var. baccata]